MIRSDLERRIILVGLSPGEPVDIPTRPTHRRQARLLHILFGFPVRMPLADARLEALRAMAAAIRRSPERPDANVVAAFVAAGWDAADVDTIRAIAANGHRRPWQKDEPTVVKADRTVAADHDPNGHRIGGPSRWLDKARVRYAHCHSF